LKISFFAGNLLPIHASILDERPMGGTETAVIRLAEKLKNLGHQVRVYTSAENPPPSEPQYLPLQEIEKSEPIDVFVSVRDWIPLFYRVPAKKRMFWTGDSYDQFSNYGLGDRRVIQQVDHFLAVSQWQADEICSRSGFPKEKVYKLPNGIERDWFLESLPKIEKRLIYSSTPYRGLQFVPPLFRWLHEKIPDVELRVFSSYKIYDQNQDFSALKNELQSLPNTKIQESILQKDLAKEFLQAGILFYPCHFEETSCITAIEAMAGGCVPVTSRLGALAETIAEAGVLVDGTPSEAAYVKSFLEASLDLLNHPERLHDLSQKGIERSKRHDWKHIAKDFEKFVGSLL
jgi:glycosyltransferase involved in cell wall biosynthesis